MKKFLPVLLLVAAPVSSLAVAQTQLVPKETKGATKGAVARADDCAPIGRTAKGELVYSLKCENLPAPPAPPPQAEAKEAPPPEPETQRSGLFGWSYDRRN
ncbi:hypothetical protein AAFX91_04070 [Bradyrhizobium sp. 31Argb]|uniref:hypothetical protein n=1 Tax=Bradyrhizobium TaxID=374 RepID=UPI00102A37C1|nr:MULTISPECIES: hypothetical protein [Bradyrhizobium]MBO4223761.1 hypothetical protein [Bradyrhizobium neotropicale]MDI4237652.1 hypothetical protein [Bradyrhizobium sp. Arg237L]RZN16277.1 hypothetical protein CWO90_40095 [Bradyrhizobium sp. Leo121]